MATTLTRSGTFDAKKLNTLAGQLAGFPGAQVYKTGTGLSVLWPVDLTAPQQTSAQTIINAYSEPTDTAALPKQVQQAVAYLGVGSPTLAQSQAALRGVIKYLLQQAAGKDTVDGVDVSS